MEVLAKVDRIAADPAVGHVPLSQVLGLSEVREPSYGSVIIKLKDWETFSRAEFRYGGCYLFMRAQKVIKDAQVFILCSSYDSGIFGVSMILVNMQEKPVES